MPPLDFLLQRPQRSNTQTSHHRRAKYDIILVSLVNLLIMYYLVIFSVLFSGISMRGFRAMPQMWKYNCCGTIVFRCLYNIYMCMDCRALGLQVKPTSWPSWLQVNKTFPVRKVYKLPHKCIYIYILQLTSLILHQTEREGERESRCYSRWGRQTWPCLMILDDISGLCVQWVALVDWNFSKTGSQQFLVLWQSFIEFLAPRLRFHFHFGMKFPGASCDPVPTSHTEDLNVTMKRNAMLEFLQLHIGHSDFDGLNLISIGNFAPYLRTFER